MAITVSWDNEAQTIIRQQYEGQWTWDVFYTDAAEVTWAMMKTVSHPVYIISDFTLSTGIPVGGALTHARNVLSKYPDNWNGIIIVSPSQFVQSLVAVFRRLFSSTHLSPEAIGNKTHAVKTLSEAYALIEALEDRESV